MKVRRRVDGTAVPTARLLDAAPGGAHRGRRPAPRPRTPVGRPGSTAAEATAWVAASEAAWVGVPDAVASAVEPGALEGPVRGTGPEGTAGVASRRPCGPPRWAAAAGRAGGWPVEPPPDAIDARLANPASPETVAAVPLEAAWERAVRGAACGHGRQPR